MSRLMSRLSGPLAALALSFGVVACGGDGGNGTVDFAGFLSAMIANTSDSTDPIDINTLAFQFPTSPTAFDSVLNN